MEKADYRILIEEDEVEKEKYKIIISNGNKLVGVPLRGASMEKAVEQISSIRYAFQYGLEESKRAIQNAIWELSVYVK